MAYTSVKNVIEALDSLLLTKSKLSMEQKKGVKIAKKKFIASFEKEPIHIYKVIASSNEEFDEVSNKGDVWKIGWFTNYNDCLKAINKIKDTLVDGQKHFIKIEEADEGSLMQPDKTKQKLVWNVDIKKFVPID